jgi:hypothetical protein
LARLKKPTMKLVLVRNRLHAVNTFGLLILKM